MAKDARKTPRLLFANKRGEIFDHPDLLSVCRRGRELGLPRPDELIPLPPESEIFLLPGRRAVGLNPASGRIEVLEETAVAAFVCPGHALTGLAAYETDPGAPILPLFAYGAVGLIGDTPCVCAKKVDRDARHVFTGIPRSRVEQGVRRLLGAYPRNRLVAHFAGCALSSGCPSAKNLALGRCEAPLAASRACNARCVGCISEQPQDSGFPATQGRLAFTPTAAEIVEIMREHAGSERRPVLSFGQGCEGEPLLTAELLARAARGFRSAGGRGTVHVNTNGSRPEAAPLLAQAGFDSVRVSLASARPDAYAAYHRPQDFGFGDVTDFVREAKRAGLFVSLNLFFQPGFTDGENELAALTGLIADTRLDFVQLRNLNLDPELALFVFSPFDPGPCMGLANFSKRLRRACPWIGLGYFNPYLEEDKKLPEQKPAP